MTDDTSLPLADYLRVQRQEIDHALAAVLPSPPACPADIAEAMRYSVLAGGKRFRPLLTLAAAGAVAPQSSVTQALAMPAACAIELIHTYSLIHDDLPAMDNDTLRRGRPTLHVVYGDGMAILAGDGLLAEAFALLARAPEDGGDPAVAGRKLATIHRIADAAGSTGMVGGQAIDLRAAGHVHDAGALDADALRDMHARKTGALIRASAVAGAIMAGGAPDVVGAVDDYAASLGLAFQIVDDILDVVGDGGSLGKTVGKDAAAGKPTYPALFGLAHSRLLASEAVDAAVAALARAGLSDSRLCDIARWIGSRSS